MSLKVARFLDANARFAVAYFGWDGAEVTYRLTDGSVWVFSARAARAIGMPWLAHFESLFAAPSRQPVAAGS